MLMTSPQGYFAPLRVPVFATWDSTLTTDTTFSDGDKRADGDGAANFDGALATFFASTGKFYFEYKRNVDSGGGDRIRMGVATSAYPLNVSGSSSSIFWGFSENGNKIGGGNSDAAYGSANTTSDYVGVALDLVNSAIYFSVSGTWQNNATTGEIEAGTTTNAAFTNVTGSVGPSVTLYSSEAVTLRIPSSEWQGTAPSGFLEFSDINTGN